MNAKQLGDMPAYPVIGAPGAKEDYPGMTIRHLFAMAAMQGYCANQQWMHNACKSSGLEADVCISIAAFEVADAMLAEAAKESP